MIVIEATVSYLEAEHCRKGHLADTLSLHAGVGYVSPTWTEYPNEDSYLIAVYLPAVFRGAVAEVALLDPDWDLVEVVGALLHRTVRNMGGGGALAFDMRERVPG